MNIEDALQNWYLYLKSLPHGGPQIDTSCRSIEHRYIPEAGEVFDEEKKETEYYDIRSAERMEELVCKLPEKLKKIIILRYVKCRQLSKEQIAKKLKMDKNTFNNKLFTAKQQLSRGLYGQ